MGRGLTIPLQIWGHPYNVRQALSKQRIAPLHRPHAHAHTSNEINVHRDANDEKSAVFSLSLNTMLWQDPTIRRQKWKNTKVEGFPLTVKTCPKRLWSYTLCLQSYGGRIVKDNLPQSSGKKGVIWTRYLQDIWADALVFIQWTTSLAKRPIAGFEEFVLVNEASIPSSNTLILAWVKNYSRYQTRRVLKTKRQIKTRRARYSRNINRRENKKTGECLQCRKREKIICSDR